MKALLFVPRRYSLFSIFREAFANQGMEVHTIDFYEQVKNWEKQFNVQVFRLPDRLRRQWERYYFGKINKYYLEEYDRIQPGIVFIYNNEMILPDTLAHFRRKSKVAFFMGDHPFYTPTNRHYIGLLFQADAVFAPDTFWISQLSKMGLKNIHYLNPGIPERDYFPAGLTEEEREAYRSEVLYIGMNYPNSWGYRKAKFINEFADFGLQIHGNRHWKRFFPLFPKLERCFQERKGYIPVETVNKMYNATRIVPIDGNPGLMHGVHLRMFEALGAGALPLLEWQEDLRLIFGEGAELPAVRSYEEIPEMAAFYLNNEGARQEKVAWMKKVAAEKYSAENLEKTIFGALGLRRSRMAKHGEVAG